MTAWPNKIRCCLLKGDIMNLSVDDSSNNTCTFVYLIQLDLYVLF